MAPDRRGVHAAVSFSRRRHGPAAVAGETGKRLHRKEIFARYRNIIGAFPTRADDAIPGSLVSDTASIRRVRRRHARDYVPNRRLPPAAPREAGRGNAGAVSECRHIDGPQSRMVHGARPGRRADAPRRAGTPSP